MSPSQHGNNQKLYNVLNKKYIENPKERVRMRMKLKFRKIVEDSIEPRKVEIIDYTAESDDKLPKLYLAGKPAVYIEKKSGDLIVKCTDGTNMRVKRGDKLTPKNFNKLVYNMRKAGNRLGEIKKKLRDIEEWASDEVYEIEI